jgi:hypothetical protein
MFCLQKFREEPEELREASGSQAEHDEIEIPTDNSDDLQSRGNYFYNFFLENKY